MSRPNSRTERPRKPKIGRMEVHHTNNLWTYLQVKRSKVKVTRPTKAVTESLSYLPNGNAYEFPTWYRDRTRRSCTNKRRNLQGQRSRSQCHVVRLTEVGPISRERKALWTLKLVGRLPTPRAIMRTSFKVKSQRSSSCRQINARVADTMKLTWNRSTESVGGINITPHVGLLLSFHSVYIILFKAARLVL